MGNKRNGSWVLAFVGLLGTNGFGSSSFQSVAPMFNGNVIDAVVYGGKAFVGGDFTKVSNERMGYGIPVDKTTGQPLAGFDAVNGPVNNVAEDGNGGWFIGGDFTRVGNTDRAGFAHIFSNGKVDPNWDLPHQGYSEGMSYSDGKLYVLVGNNPTVGTYSLDLQRHNALSGQLEKKWNLYTGSDSSGPIVYVLKAALGRVYLGGVFSSFLGQAHYGIAAFDVSTGQFLTDWTGGTNGTVNDILVTESSVIVGGSFTEANGIKRPAVAAFSLSDGSVLGWDPQLGGTYPNVTSIARNGNTIYLGGYFAKAGTSSVNGFAAVNFQNAALIPMDTGKFGYVTQVAFNGKTIYLAGHSGLIQGQQRDWLAAISDTGVLTAWDPKGSANVDSLVPGSAAVFVASQKGGFLGGQTRQGFAVYDLKSGAVDPFNPGFGVVRALLLDGDTLYVADWGNKVSAIDLKSMTVTPWLQGTQIYGPVYSLAKKDNTVYVGGSFSSVNGKPRAGLASFNATTGDLLSWGPKIAKKDGSMVVNTMAVDKNMIIVGGNFETVDGQSRPNLTAISTQGVVQAWTPSPDGIVKKVLVSGKNMYVGGSFSRITASGYLRKGFAAFDSDSLDVLTWDPVLTQSDGAQVTVNGISVFESAVYIAGGFDLAKGVAKNSLAAFKEADGSLLPWDIDFGGSPWLAFVKASGDRVFVAGAFYRANGVIQLGLAEVPRVETQPVVPLPPSNVTATLRSSSTLAVHWDASSGATTYKYGIRGATEVSNWFETVNTSASMNSLTPNTGYEMVVKACSSVGCSPESSLSANTLAATPVALTTTSVQATSVAIEFNPNGNPAKTEYAIQQAASLDGQFITVLTTSTPKVRILGLTPTTVYYFRVKAKNLDGSLGDPSGVLAVKSGFSAQSMSGTIDSASNIGISASWSPVAQAISYRIGVATAPTNASESFVKINEVSGLSYTLNGLLPNTAYFLFVQACDAAVCSDYKALGSTATLANTPSLTAGSAKQNEVELTISANGNPAGTIYFVEQSSDDGLTFSQIYQGASLVVDVSGLEVGKRYQFRAKASNMNGQMTPASLIIPVETSGYSVSQMRAFPIPFRPEGANSITFDQMPVDSTIRIYTTSGTMVKEIRAGAESVSWDVKNDSGDDVGSGVYFVRVSGSGGEKTLKIVVQR